MEGLVLLCGWTTVLPLLSGLLGTQGFDTLLKGHLYAKKSDICQFLSYRYIYAMHVSNTCSLFGCLLFWLSILASFTRARRERMRERREREGEGKRDGIVSADLYLSQGPSGCVLAPLDCWKASPEPSFFKSF